MANYLHFISLGLVCLLSGLKCEEEQKGIVIKLNRQKTAFEQHINNADFLKKYGIDNIDWLHKNHHYGGGPRTNDSISLKRYIDNEFYGTVVIGHPGQTINVAFDTSWSLSWVMSSECGFRHVGCWFHNKYDHSKSSEYKPDNRPIVIPEGKYNLSGYFSYDNISISHSNVTKFSFAEMNELPYTFLFSKVDGVLGLGLQQDSYEPFFYALVRQKKIANKVFSVYLNRDKQSSQGGNVILGYIEKRHIHSHQDENKNKIYDPIKYMPVKASPYWKFDLDTVYVNIQTKDQKPLVFCNNAKCTAITDTSSNNILGPRAEVNAIHKAIGAKSFFMDRYFVDCDTINKLPVVEITIGGQNFTLKGRDYTVKLSYFALNLCLSAFVPADYNDFWVLGGAFLSEYYTIYDVENKQIGIVKAA
ncbi:uncharacterized protein LOC126735047 [Anthonomus grandis grandis]|uniref:uncharacterized protein LOC126735047 n=1 Tax=Anthonomus grandis grandis TaxID=2921223 RepID=UPI0021657999|nr:uncharacterized protein LOC126735047 [Anthonomus grandis grandis]